MIGTAELTAAMRIAYLMQSYSDAKPKSDYPRETREELLSWNNNFLPSDEDLGRIRSLIADAERNLDILDGEIFRVWQEKCDGPRVEKLLKQREEDAVRLGIMRIANSPLKRVPPEILGKIFMWYIGGQIIFPLKQTSNPWKLGHVSSQWRQVLWSTADLWNDLEISFPTGCDKNTDIVGSLSIVRSALNDVLYRGKGLHNLRIFSHSITPVADLIFPFVHRFRSLSIKNVSYGIFISLLELPTGAFPFLENIDLDIYYDPASAVRTSHTSSLQAAPNLTSVNLSFRPTKGLTRALDHVDISSPFLPPLPWSQLSQLVLTSVGIPWPIAQRILTKCSSLLFCRITICHIVNSIHTSSYVVLRNLETLQLTQVGTVEWDKFLDPFEFPSLQNLAINPGPSLNTLYPLICLKAITSLVLRSGCHLQAFSIGGAMDYRENHHLPSVIIPDVSEIIKASPTLKILEGTLILPASIFIAMKSGQLHLPKLHLLIVRLDPDGLRAFVDFLNSLIHFEGNQQLPTYSGTIRRAIISCQATDGYQTAMDAFTDGSRLYQAVGIYVSVESIEIDYDGE